MEEALLVQIKILNPEDKDTCTIASGYPVAPDIILTAKHVLGQAAENPAAIQIRWRSKKGKAREWRSIEKVVWPGNDDLDVALLRCPFPVGVTPHGILSKGRPEVWSQWQSKGFAAAGKTGERREPVGAIGRVTAKEGDLLQLGANYSVALEEDWRGMSGAPVFVGAFIVGVIVTAPDHFDAGRLHATPLQRCLEDPEFQQKLGLPNRNQQRLTKVQDKLKHLLDQPSADRVDLVLRQAFGCSEADDLSEVLIQQPIVEIMKKLCQIQARFDAESCPQEVELVGQIAHLIVQVSFVDELADFDEHSFGPCLVEMPATTETIVELVMAEIKDKRPAKHQRRQLSDSREGWIGRYHIEHYPVSGDNVSATQIVHSISRDLLKKASKAIPKGYGPKEYLREARRDLEQKSDIRKTSYLIMPYAEAGDEQHIVMEAARKLTQRFPHLCVLAMVRNSKLLDQQRKVAGSLETILSLTPNDKKKEA